MAFGSSFHSVCFNRKETHTLRFEFEKTESGKELAVKMPHVHVYPVALDTKQ